MKKFLGVLWVFLIPTMIYPQQIIENTEKPLSEKTGRMLHLKEELRITDDQGGFYFKSPHKIKVSPDGHILVIDEDQLLKFDAHGQFMKNLFRKGRDRAN